MFCVTKLQNNQKKYCFSFSQCWLCKVCLWK